MSTSVSADSGALLQNIDEVRLTHCTRNHRTANRDRKNPSGCSTKDFLIVVDMTDKRVEWNGRQPSGQSEFAEQFVLSRFNFSVSQAETHGEFGLDGHSDRHRVPVQQRVVR